VRESLPNFTPAHVGQQRVAVIEIKEVTLPTAFSEKSMLR